MADKKKRISMVTPKGTEIYPKLNSPDTKFDPAGKYTTKHRMPANDPDVQKFKARLEAIRDEFYDAEVARLKAEKKAGLALELTKADVLTVERDGETGEETGFLILVASMKASGTRKDGSTWTQKPDIFDAKGKKLKNPPSIWGGTEAKLGVDVDAFLNNTSKKVTVSARLTAVQIIKLVSGGQRDFGGYGFAEEEGDEIEDREVSPFDGTDESNGSDGNDDL